ncbi:MAG: helix-turn-helix domain-containing protein [Thermoguttaceae bacterium]
MANLLTTLKQEIQRVARKEVRAQIDEARRAAGQYRRELTRLKRQLLQQQKVLMAVKAKVGEPIKETVEDTVIPLGARFSPRSVRAQRRRLKLSAAQYAKLLGVSAQTVYLWERGKVRPAKAQFATLLAARNLGRREALQRLRQLSG